MKTPDVLGPLAVLSLLFISVQYVVYDHYNTENENDGSGSCGTNVSYVFDADTGTLTISGDGDIQKSAWSEYLQLHTKTLIIEAPVRSIGYNTFDWFLELTSVRIPDTVTSIGDYAFSLCLNITSLTIPDSVTKIGCHAFEYCQAMESLTIGRSVESIGNAAFLYCNGLTEIGFNAEDCDDLRRGTNVFRNAGRYSGISVVFGDAVKHVPAYLFCVTEGFRPSLMSVDLGNSVESIGEGAFDKCGLLKSVTIPDTVQSIGEGAFSAVKFIHPDGTTELEKTAKYLCGHSFFGLDGNLVLQMS